MTNKKNTFNELQYGNLAEYYTQYLKHLSSVGQSVDTDRLENFYQIIKDVIQNNGVIYTAGNGGSASISNHLNVDFVKGISTNTKILPKVVPLASETSLMTAISNDIDFSNIFSFQIEGRINPNDLLFLISSSGNSINILNALSVAKKANAKTLLICGFDGGKALKMADEAIFFDAQNYGIIEDLSQIVIHCLSQFIRLKNLENLGVKKLKL